MWGLVRFRLGHCFFANGGYILQRATYSLERVPHDKQVAIATFLDLGYSWKKIQNFYRCVGPNTISLISKTTQPNDVDVIACKKVVLAKSWALSNRAINRITDDKLDACSAPQLAMVAGIFTDKARDMEGHNRPQFNIVTIIGECKQTRDKLEAQMQAVQRARTSMATITVGETA